MELGGVLGNACDGHHTSFIPSLSVVLLHCYDVENKTRMGSITIACWSDTYIYHLFLPTLLLYCSNKSTSCYGMENKTGWFQYLI